MKIEVKNLSKKFNEREVLKDINISFYSGNIYCLAGPNGSGKSLFLKLLCGSDNPTKGEILLNGKNLIRRRFFSRKQRKLIENDEFLPNLTGYENLQLIAKIKKDISNEDILVALKKVKLIDYMDCKYRKYSFGMRQRLMIAKVLMEDPKVIILDDPFNGVDADVKKYLIDVLKFAKDRDRIVIISTINDIEIKRLADVTYSFSDGNLFWT